MSARAKGIARKLHFSNFYKIHISRAMMQTNDCAEQRTLTATAAANVKTYFRHTYFSGYFSSNFISYTRSSSSITIIFLCVCTFAICSSFSIFFFSSLQNYKNIHLVCVGKTISAKRGERASARVCVIKQIVFSTWQKNFGTKKKETTTKLTM